MYSLPKGDALSLPKGWELKKLGEVCDVFNGSTPLRRKKEYWDNGTINWFTVDDIRKQGRTIKFTHQKITGEGFKSSSLKLLPINSILLCCTASVGEFAITQVELTTNQQFNGLVVKNEIYLLPKYLFYFSSTLKEKLLNLSRKTTIDFVSMGKVKNISIPLPPLLEQKRIVAILEKAFTAIDQAKANTEKNLKNARELFQSKLQETFANGKLKIDSGEWEKKKLGEVCDIAIGKTPARSNKKFWDIEKETNNIWLSIRDLGNTQGKEVVDSREYISNSGAKLCNLVKKGTLLASFKLTLGRLAFAGTELYTNEAIASLKIKNKGLANEYLYHYLTFFDWDAETKGDVKIKGKTLNKPKLKKIKILIPPLPEQKQIVKKLDVVSTETKKLETIYQRKITCLDELKKSILQKAFNGEL